MTLEGVWAYANRLYEEGYKSTYSSEERRVNELEMNSRFYIDSSEFELVQRFFEKGDKNVEGCEFMTTTDMAMYINDKVGEDGIKMCPRSLGRAFNSDIGFETGLRRGNRRKSLGVLGKCAITFLNMINMIKQKKTGEEAPIKQTRKEKDEILKKRQSSAFECRTKKSEDVGLLDESFRIVLSQKVLKTAKD